MSTKNAARSARTARSVKPARTAENTIKFESDEEMTTESVASSAARPSERAAVTDATVVDEESIIVELTDEKPVVKSAKKELTPRQKTLNNRRYINNFMERIVEKYGIVTQVNVFAYTDDNAKGHSFTNRFNKPDMFWSVNVVRALVHTADGKIELLAKELWELFECTPMLSLNGYQTKDIKADSYMQLTINGSPKVSTKGYKNYGFSNAVYSSEDYRQLIMKRKDQFNIDTNNNGYRAKYPWFDDSDLIGDAKPVDIDDF